VIWDWTSSNTFQEHWQSTCGQRQAKGFLKKTLCKKSWGIVQFEQKPAKKNDMTANTTLSVKRTPI